MTEATKFQDSVRLFSASAADVYDTSNTVWTMVPPALYFSEQDVLPLTRCRDDASKKAEA